MSQPKREEASPHKEADLNITEFARRDKVTHYSGQRGKVLLAFSGLPKTMLQVSLDTSVDRANICRYVSYFRKHDLIILNKTGLCPISTYRAGFYLATGKELQDE